jgi:hypothetical protein
MGEQQDRPLWEVMHNAHATAEHQSFFVSQGPQRGYAAELRAIADAVVPEEPHIPSEITAVILRAQRQRIRALLLAEAERAEKGDADG